MLRNSSVTYQCTMNKDQNEDMLESYVDEMIKYKTVYDRSEDKIRD